MILVITLAGVGLTAAGGDIFIYRWSRSGASFDMALSLLSWAVSLILFGLFLRWSQRSLGPMFVVAATVHTALILLWDILVEKNTWTVQELIGIILGIVAIALVEMGGNESPKTE